MSSLSAGAKLLNFTPCHKSFEKYLYTSWRHTLYKHKEPRQQELMQVQSFVTLILLCLTVVYGHRGPQDAARIARRMVDKESLVHFNTLNPDGTPVSFVEYYISSDLCPGLQNVTNNGNPILFLSTMSSSYQNWDERGAVSLSVESYKKHPFESALSKPRATLFGDLRKLHLSDHDEHRLVRCFTHKHPDAYHWLPGSKNPTVNDTLWVEFDVKHLYFIGGFGDRSYIGNISGPEYHHKHGCGHRNRVFDGPGALDYPRKEVSSWGYLMDMVKRLVTMY